jgi:hypothetical protein
MHRPTDRHADEDRSGDEYGVRVMTGARAFSITGGGADSAGPGSPLLEASPSGLRRPARHRARRLEARTLSGQTPRIERILRSVLRTRCTPGGWRAFRGPVHGRRMNKRTLPSRQGAGKARVSEPPPEVASTIATNGNAAKVTFQRARASPVRKRSAGELRRAQRHYARRGGTATAGDTR